MIDERLIGAYLSELDALRRHGAEVAAAYPDIAARLDIGPERSRDPSVERVVESTAFLAARLRMLIETTGQELPLALLSMLAPILLDPVPSMAVATLEGGREPVPVPRGTALDYHAQGRAVLRFETTMATVATPARLIVRRLAPAAGLADGLALRVRGPVPEVLSIFIGRDRLSASRLIDALSRTLVRIERVSQRTEGQVLPASVLRFRGYGAGEACLAPHTGSQPAYRLMTELMTFPDKFRFITLTIPRLRADEEIRLWFARPLGLSGGPGATDGLMNLNRVPIVNLWSETATPFEVTGRRLEYPVRADTQRYRQVDCHTVQSVEAFIGGGTRPVRLDPIVGTARRGESPVEWGVRRAVNRAGSEVMMYFRGVDYAELGSERFLVSPQILASNGRLAQNARTGARLIPTRSLAGWRLTLASVPTAYAAPLAGTDAMRTLLGHIQGGTQGLVGLPNTGAVREYLRGFPGAEKAAWVDALGVASSRAVLALREGQTVQGARVFVEFDAERARTESAATIERVLAMLLDTQRG